MTVGELVVKIAADTSALARGLVKGRAEMEGFAESVQGSSRDMNAFGRSADDMRNRVASSYPALDKLFAKSDALAASMRGATRDTDDLESGMSRLGEEARRAGGEMESERRDVAALSREAGRAHRSWVSWAGALKMGLPVLIGVGLAALQLTGNMGALAPILPVLTVALGAFLAPLTSLAAIIVLLVGPLSVLLGLLGGLGAAFGFSFMKEAGDKTSYLYGKVQQLTTMFGHLTSTLATVFRPQFMFLIDSAEQAIKYFDQLAHMPLAQAFKSLTTTGIPAVKQFLEQVGHMLANPIRLAVQLAFGRGGNSANSALGSLFDQVKHFFSSSAGGKPSIDATIGSWFGARDFTAIGMRWGMDLASAVFSAFGLAFQHLIQTRGGKMILGGAGVGAGVGLALGGPIGAALGAAIGSAAGIALNHYWPKITSEASRVWTTVKTRAVADFHAITTALEHFLGPTTWGNLAAIARSTWTIIRTVAVGAFRAIVAVGRTVWAVFDTLVIKTGLWKVALAIVKAAIFIVAAVLRPIIAIIQRIVSIAVRLGSVFNGAVLAGVRAVAGAIAAIIGGIQSAVGLAEKLAGALQASGSASMAPGKGRLAAQGNGGGGRAPSVMRQGSSVVHHTTNVILPNVYGTADRNGLRQLARDLQPHIGRQIVLSSRG